MNYKQIDNLKTAQAYYELVPVTIYAPYLFVMMRKVAKANTGALISRFVLLTICTAPFVELGQRYLRDTLYWPLVRQTYLEIKEESRKPQQLPYFMMQAL